MRVTSIELYSNDSRIACFEVNEFDVLNPYVIKGITGLDADNIIPRYYGQGTSSLGKYYDLALDPREIVLRIGSNPNYSLSQTHSDLRDAIYRAISSSRTSQIQLRFKVDNTIIAAISGFVTKLEAPLFDKEVEMQLTMRCDDPMLRAINLTQVTGFTDEDHPTITDAYSTAPHGFKFQITFVDDVDGFSVSDNSGATDWTFEIDYAFEDGNVLYFSSEFGNKYLYIEEVMSIGPIINIMEFVIPGSMWPILFPGDNDFAISTDQFIWNDISYFETYWGV